MVTSPVDNKVRTLNKTLEIILNSFLRAYLSSESSFQALQITVMKITEEKN